eukprot:jgi/Bigna1/132546/aug1.18_g7254
MEFVGFRVESRVSYCRYKMMGYDWLQTPRLSVRFASTSGVALADVDARDTSPDLLHSSVQQVGAMEGDEKPEEWREEDSRPPIHHPKPREEWTGGKEPRPVVFRWELKRLWEHASSLLDHPLHDYYSEPYNYGPFRFRTFLQFPKISSRNSRSVRDARALRSILVYLKVLDPPKSKEASLTVTFAFSITNPKDPSKSKVFNYTHSFKGKKEWTAGLPKEKALSFRLLQGMGFFHNGSLMIETHISHVTPKGFSCAPNSIFGYSPAYLRLESWHDCNENNVKGGKGSNSKKSMLLLLSESSLLHDKAVGSELWLASHRTNGIPSGTRVKKAHSNGSKGSEKGKKRNRSSSSSFSACSSSSSMDVGHIDLPGFSGEIKWCRAPAQCSINTIGKLAVSDRKLGGVDNGGSSSSSSSSSYNPTAGRKAGGRRKGVMKQQQKQQQQQQQQQQQCQQQEFWAMAERRNGSRRPDSKLTPMQLDRPYGSSWLNRERWFYCSKCKQHCRRPLWLFHRISRPDDYQ